MISSGINLVMTVIGFAVSTMFIVFVCTRLICARIHLNSSRRSFAIASRPDLSIVSIVYCLLLFLDVLDCTDSSKHDCVYLILRVVIDFGKVSFDPMITECCHSFEAVSV